MLTSHSVSLARCTPQQPTQHNSQAPADTPSVLLQQGERRKSNSEPEGQIARGCTKGAATAAAVSIRSTAAMTTLTTASTPSLVTKLFLESVKLGPITQMYMAYRWEGSHDGRQHVRKTFTGHNAMFLPCFDACTGRRRMCSAAQRRLARSRLPRRSTGAGRRPSPYRTSRRPW